MLKIGYDAKRVFHNFTGLGNYARTLLADLVTQFPEEAYHLFSPGFTPNPRTEPFVEAPFRVHCPAGGSAAIWRSWGMSRDVAKAGIDLFHGLSHELPVGLEKRGIPSVVSMHDLIFRQFPEQYPWFDRQIYDLKFRSACRRATQVVAISQHTARDLQAAYGLPPERIKVIYQSCHPQFFAPGNWKNDQQILRQHGLPADFGLYVGSVVPRKNLLGVVQALAQLPAGQRPPLVVVGAGKAYLQQVRQFVGENNLSGSVFFPEKVTFSDLPALYRRARFFVYPSFYEGFGIPIIEALACGTPVITAATSSLPEAGGPDSLYLDPANPEALTQAIQRVNEDQALAKQMRQAGRAYVQRFRGRTIARQWMRLYRELTPGVE